MRIKTYRVVLGAAITGAWVAVSAAVPPPDSHATPVVSSELQELVTGYFRSMSATTRADIAERIEQRGDATFASVANAIGQVNLWEAHVSGMQRTTVRSVTGRETEVSIHVPAG